jgi:hypothetical protein
VVAPCPTPKQARVRGYDVHADLGIAARPDSQPAAHRAYRSEDTVYGAHIAENVTAKADFSRAKDESEQALAK